MKAKQGAMHRLLHRQMKRHVEDASSLPQDVRALLGAVDIAYRQEDDDRRMLEHSLDTMSQELMERNQALRTELNERRVAESKLEQSLSTLRATLESTADGILVVSNERGIESYNRKFLEMWRIPQELIDHWNDHQAIAFVMDQLEEPGQFVETIERMANSEEPLFDLLEFKDGRIFERYSQPRHVGDRLVGRVWSFRDVTQRLASERRLAYLANYDPLTRLPNRNLLRDRLQQAILHAARERQRLAVLFLDLDNFKNVNDTLGHAIGDRILEEAAARLTSCCRKSDTIARLGGDEYTLVLEDISEPDEAASVAQQLLAAFAKPFHVEGREVFCSASIGIAVYPADADNIEDLMKNADAAMYRAKEQGRNHYQFFTADMNRKAMERLLLGNSLRRALDRGEFRLYYQPQLDLRTRRVAGIEALLRWEHPDLGVVLPGQFISMLEETGIIIPVGEWLLREACRFNASLSKQGLAPLRLSVNCSIRQFRQPYLLELVSRVLRETGLDPRFLELEITESVLAEAHLDTTSLERLKEMGVRFVIDDFGTGYSSLSYLQRFPIDSLKVDQSFVRDIMTDAHSAEITSAVISLGRILHLNVIAEGVETMDQLRYLEQKGCHEVQGYVYARPMPGEDLIHWLRSNAFVSPLPERAQAAA